MITTIISIEQINRQCEATLIHGHTYWSIIFMEPFGRKRTRQVFRQKSGKLFWTDSGKRLDGFSTLQVHTAIESIATNNPKQELYHAK